MTGVENRHGDQSLSSVCSQTCRASFPLLLPFPSPLCTPLAGESLHPDSQLYACKFLSLMPASDACVCSTTSSIPCLHLPAPLSLAPKPSWDTRRLRLSGTPEGTTLHALQTATVPAKPSTLCQVPANRRRNRPQGTSDWNILLLCLMIPEGSSSIPEATFAEALLQ